MKNLEVTVDAFFADGSIDVIRPVGVIDNNTSHLVANAFHELLSRDRYKLILDLGNVNYISSAGWGIFIGEIRNIRAHQGDLKLACLMQDVEEVYRVLEFDTILKAYPSIDAAAREFK
jgi:anti-sigma B factor antagonist